MNYFVFSKCGVVVLCTLILWLCGYLKYTFLSWWVWILTPLCRVCLKQGLVKKTSLTPQVDQSTTTKCIRSTTPRAPGRKHEHILYGWIRISLKMNLMRYLECLFSCTFMYIHPHPSKDRARCRVWHEDQFCFIYGTFVSQQPSRQCGQDPYTKTSHLNRNRFLFHPG